MKIYSAYNQKGFTLIELMIAMTIGLFLMGGLLQVYASNKRAYVLQNAYSEIQRNGRFVIKTISKNINSAGYTGFFGDMSQGVESLLKQQDNQLWDITKPLLGFDQVSATDTIAGITGFDAGTDVLIIKRMIENTALTDNPSGGLIKIKNNTNIVAGDILFLTDVDQASVFQADKVLHSDADNTSVYINLANAVLPGNTGIIDNAYSVYSELGKLETLMYYISDETLYEASLVLDEGNLILQPQVLAPNVTDLQLTYGEDSNGDGLVDTYSTAADVGAWSNVINIGLTLLASSTNQIRSEPKTAYMFDANTFGFVPDSESTTDANKNIKRTFRTFSSIRNRAL